jgi:hypothetical protein
MAGQSSFANCRASQPGCHASEGWHLDRLLGQNHLFPGTTGLDPSLRWDDKRKKHGSFPVGSLRRRDNKRTNDTTEEISS